ncbi:MAG: hypothetical protein HYU69_01230 [Bacteroidetes bacterium]|nr:hypothetical protein [Bacteroidota bacterium]
MLFQNRHDAALQPIPYLKKDKDEQPEHEEEFSIDVDSYKVVYHSSIRIPGELCIHLPCSHLG